ELADVQEFDGSDSGARPDEAVSWGKIRLEAKPVKVTPAIGPANVRRGANLRVARDRFWRSRAYAAPTIRKTLAQICAPMQYNRQKRA
ncbi:deoxyhypusine synthase, partial [Haematococcus lacustris]